jgi:hypothetical protein
MAQTHETYNREVSSGLLSRKQADVLQEFNELLGNLEEVSHRLIPSSTTLHIATRLYLSLRRYKNWRNVNRFH